MEMDRSWGWGSRSCFRAQGHYSAAVFRSLSALWLFATVFSSYAAQWVIWRATGRRLFTRRWASVHERNAARLARGFLRLRGVFIKMGQVLSVLGTFLPSAYALALRPLQDAVPPRPLSELEPRFRAVWGPHSAKRLASLEPNALAAASLAQVHRGKTHDGRDVAVKVLTPGIESLVRRDLRVVRMVLPVVHGVFGFRKLPTVIDQLERMLHHELDYEREAENIARFRTMFADRDDLRVPEVVQELSGPGVLVMSLESGVKLDDDEGLAAQGIDREAVAKTLVECYLSMLFRHRIFHVDPHPGNFLAQPGNRLVMLDFGAVEPVSEELVRGIETVMMGGLARDADKVIAGIHQMGFVAEDGDHALIDSVGREYLKALGQIRIQDFANIDPSTVVQLSGVKQWKGKLRAVAGSVRYPEGYFYIERAVVLLFGLVGRLAPNKGLLGIAAPYASKILLRSMATRRVSGSK
jgi:ubiquinone biosynthesis protein